MIATYTITGAEWTPITTAGQSLKCWLDENSEGAVGEADVRIVHSTTGIPNYVALTSAKKIYRPGGNDDILKITADSSEDIFYARCFNADDQVVLQVDSFLASVNISQNVLIDVNNSSTTNLDASNSYTFTGVGTSTLGVNGLQWSLKTDQNAIVYVEQSNDNVNWDISYPFDYINLYGGQGETVQATANYWRIRVVLSVTTPTTYFRLNAILCPIAIPLPSALTADGRLKVEAHIAGIYSEVRHVWVSPRNQLISSKHIRLIGESFDGINKDPNAWNETVLNGGTVVQGGGQITLNTNTTANGSAKYESEKKAQYIPGTTHLFLARTFSPQNVVANNLRRIGPYDDDNGFFFQGADVFGIGIRKGGVDTIIEDGSFNGAYGQYFPTNINVYFSVKIEYTPTAAYWYIDGKLMHTIEGVLLVETNTLPITIENVNSGGITTPVSFSCVEASIMREGELITGNTSYLIEGDAATHNIKYSSGKLQTIIFNNTAGTSLTLYDSITGAGKEIGNITTKTSGPWPYDVEFSNGLTIVTVGNGLNATVVFE